MENVFSWWAIQPFSLKQTPSEDWILLNWFSIDESEV
jgi:hypothetical protein